MSKDSFFLGSKKEKKNPKKIATEKDSFVNEQKKRKYSQSRTVEKSMKKNSKYENNSHEDVEVEHDQGDQGDQDGDAMGIDLDLKNDFGEAQVDDEEEDEFLKETPAQKRLRLAKSYLEKVKEDVEDDIMAGEIDAKDLDRELIGERLEKEVNAERAFTPMAENFRIIDYSKARVFSSGRKGHQLSLTCVAFSAPPQPKSTLLSKQTPPNLAPPLYIYSGSKDAVLVKWNFWTGEKMHVVSGNLKPTKRLSRKMGKKKLPSPATSVHCDEIWCMDASSDGKFIVTGGLDKAIRIWSTESNELIGHLNQHRDAVTGLKFRKGHNQLYSSSYDRTVKVWNVDEKSYVETLFGHQDKITSIDALSKERCITSGSRDRTCRLWKIVEESQLVFRGGGGGLSASEDVVVLETMGETSKKRLKDSGESGGSIDRVVLLDEEYFVSGSDSGSLSLWSTHKKKSIFTKLKCHGPGAAVLLNGQESKLPSSSMTGSTDPSCDTVCSWITALAAIKYSDFFVSGSADGYLRLWKVSSTKKSFALVNCVPVSGFINDLVLFQAPALSLYTSSGDGDEDKGGEEVDQTAPLPSSSLGHKVSGVAQRILEKEKLAQAAKARQAKMKPEVYVAAAVGREHRLGRWWRLKSVKNSVHVLSLGSA